MLELRRTVARVVSALVLASASHLVIAQESLQLLWPAIIVKLEDLRPLSDFTLRVPDVVSKGRVTGPAILRAHITTEGSVAKVALLESCGNGDLDEASMHAMRAMQFKPHTFDGIPTEVTLIAPVHVPSRWGRSR